MSEKDYGIGDREGDLTFLDDVELEYPRLAVDCAFFCRLRCGGFLGLYDCAGAVAMQELAPAKTSTASRKRWCVLRGACGDFLLVALGMELAVERH